jgi:hypothetical protein
MCLYVFTEGELRDFPEVKLDSESRTLATWTLTDTSPANQSPSYETQGSYRQP